MWASYGEVGALALGVIVLGGVVWRLALKKMRAHRGRRIALRRLHSW